MGLLDSLTAQLQDNGSLSPAGMGLLSAGMGILAHNRGLTSGMQAVGMGGQEGLQAYASAKQLGMQQKLQDAQLQQAQFGLKQKQFLYDLAKQYMGGDQGAQGSPQTPAMPPAGNGGVPPLASSPAQSSQLPTMPYGDGTGGMSMQAPQQQPPMPQPATGSAPAPRQSGGPFGNMPGGLVAYGLMADPGKLFEVAANQYAPTDLMKTMTAMGIPRGSPQWNQMLQQNLAKSNYIAPVSGRPGGYLSYPDGRQEQLPQVPEGFTAQKDENGQWKVVPVKGGTDAMRASAAATAGGKAAFKPVQVYNPKTGQMEYTSEAAVVGGNQPQPMLPLGMQARADYFRNIQDPQLKQSFAQAVYKSFQGMPNADQLGQQWSQVINGQQGGGSSGGASGFAAAPPLGTVTAANAAQGAPSEQMKNDYATMAGAGPQTQQSVEYLDHMLDIAKRKPFYMGAGIGGVPGMTNVSTDAAEYEKARASYLASQGKALGSSGTDAARATLNDAVPEYGKPQDAMIRGLTDQRNQLVTGMLRRQFLTQVYQTGDEKTYTALANGFDQNIKPSMAPVLSLPPGSQLAAVQAAIKADPSLRPHFEWAFNHGLLK